MSQTTFSKIDSSTEVVDYLSSVIRTHLEAGDKVLWLLSGGSAIDLEVAIARKLSNIRLDSLSVALLDERYGPINHQNSNWYQLEQAGFSLPGAKVYRVLNGREILPTTREFESWLNNAYKNSDYKIGLLGMGPDGHTSGILPGSPALRAKALVCAYSSSDFQRITTTAFALGQLDEAVLYAVGRGKWPQLERLQTSISPVTQPAQLLKQVPKLTVFNDRLGDPI